MSTPAPLSFIFGLFKQTIQFLQQINVKNVHPVYGAKIQPHDLSKMSCLPQPLDKVSCPKSFKTYSTADYKADESNEWDKIRNNSGIRNIVMNIGI